MIIPDLQPSESHNRDRTSFFWSLSPCQRSRLCKAIASLAEGPKRKMEGDVHLPVIRNSFVPQDEQVPVSALRPFLRVTVRGKLISLFFFSFTQNAVVIAISA